MTNQNSAAQIQIKLINAIDEALIARELLSPKSLRCCEVEAILDPGLVYLVLPEKIAKQLGLRLASPQQAPASTEALRLEWHGHLITEDAIIEGDQVRLGRVVLEKLDLMTGLVLPLPPSAKFQLDKAEPDFWDT